MATLLDVGSDGSLIKYGEQDGKIYLETHHPDMKSVEKYCSEMRATNGGAFDKKADLHHVMRIPSAILTKICADTGLDFFDTEDSKTILAILKGPQYAKFRTYAGKI